MAESSATTAAEKDPSQDNIASNEAPPSFLDWMEPVTRVFLAGFGGAVAGLSFSRQTRSRHPMARVGGDANLPAAWAMACMSFAGIVECTAMTSPMSWVTQDPYIRTVGDYTLGGSVAGAAFRGMHVQSGARKTAVSIPVTSPRVLSGLVPGMALGLLAGVLLAASDYVDTLVEEEIQRQRIRDDQKELDSKPQ